MDILNTLSQIRSDYESFIKSFEFVADARIQEAVQKAYESNLFLPDALVQFNPAYEQGGTLAHLRTKNLNLLTELDSLIPYSLHRHQADALVKGLAGQSFVVTSGTGSGKSLTYLTSIFNYCIQNRADKGIKAVLVYPMNALINSQEKEIFKFLLGWFRAKKGMISGEPTTLAELQEQIQQANLNLPFTYACYTGQESAEEKERVRKLQPDILLTNYMMLELMMTRAAEDWARASMENQLHFLVLDELHTYRGRQGADVAMLVRRIKGLIAKRRSPLICIGTSATMANGADAKQRKEAVARVASQIFGETFTVEQVIEETLQTSTETVLADRTALRVAIHNSHSMDLAEHPLMSWLEQRVALKREYIDEAEKWVRNEPLSIPAIAAQLGEDAEIDTRLALEAVMGLLNRLEEHNRRLSSSEPKLLPYRMHQFISQVGMVQATLHTPGEREILLTDEYYYRSGGADLPLFPVVFSRVTGHEFLCVEIHGKRIVRRKPDDVRLRSKDLEEDDIPSDKGYIFFLKPGQEDWEENWSVDNLPDTWIKRGKVLPAKNARLPRPIWVTVEGKLEWSQPLDLEGYTQAWYIQAPLVLDPSAGVFFDGKQGEFTKVGGLGSEGRSTATSLLSWFALKALSGSDRLQARKILSFTDNRQDASLQAGHFNDFIMLARLRAALVAALKTNKGVLTHDRLAAEVSKQLAIPQSEYANTPAGSIGPLGRKNEEAFALAVTYRLLQDLKHGWRYTAPNLEQTGLLRIDYQDLEACSEVDGHFAFIPLLRTMEPAERAGLLKQILNYLRTGKALDYTRDLQDTVSVEKRINEHIRWDSFWGFDKEEHMDDPALIVPGIPAGINRLSVGKSSYVGKYIRRQLASYGIEQDVETCVEQILAYLAEAGYLSRKAPFVFNKISYQAYRVAPSMLEWRLHDGNPIPDEVRINSREAVQHPVNSFFKDLYQTDFSDFSASLEAREHTGQISNADREDRETRFREGKLGVLYCSPTMELGIDIADLSIVHMRNVPPNPANYAQRSGRAGRGGQGALVFTYCSTASPHDVHYFRHRKEMVSGAVNPPSLDLTNLDLIQAHLHAFLFMKIGLDFKSSITEVLEHEVPSQPIRAKHDQLIRTSIKSHSNAWAGEFHSMLTSQTGGTEVSLEQIADWAESFPDSFDRAFDRWRNLYQTFLRQMMDADERRRLNPQDDVARWDSHRAQTMLQMLYMSDGNQNSEFYLYRYLAAEGFLPCYNFTKLPVRSFMIKGGSQEGQEVVSRQRSLALKEFGPRNIIYHNGGKYVVEGFLRMPGQELKTVQLRYNDHTGYALLRDQNRAADPINDALIPTQSRLVGLLALEDVQARSRMRINSQEEERVREGYNTLDLFEFSQVDRVRITDIGAGNALCMTMFYDKAAHLISVNEGFKSRAEDNQRDGFRMMTRTGRWLSESRVIDSEWQRVKLYTSTQNDILYLQPTVKLDLDREGIQSLAYALKRAIEVCFKMEPGELGVRMMGEASVPNILIYENAEGSLGVLSKITSLEANFRAVLEEAIKICHYAIQDFPHDIVDMRPDTPKASYDNLLSYYNQPDHSRMDRHKAAQGAFRLLSLSLYPRQEAGVPAGSREEQYRRLLAKYDRTSDMERRFIDYLYDQGLRLPDEAQPLVPGITWTRPDFLFDFDRDKVLIFVDGAVHDAHEVRLQDEQKRDRCRAKGFTVLEWHYSQPLEVFIKQHDDIFTSSC